MSSTFLTYLQKLQAARQPLALEALVARAGGPENIAILGVDLVKGFMSEGPLASPRVGNLAEPVVRILQQAWGLGVRHLLFPCDSHPEDSPEFVSFPPHCLSGTREAELADELLALPFELKILPKRSLNAWIGTELGAYLKANPAISNFIVIGDCTDLCVYQAAMHLRLTANAQGHRWEVIVPAAAVDTYDLPLEQARELGAMAHDAEFLQLVFLYHMQLNGIQVVSDLT